MSTSSEQLLVLGFDKARRPAPTSIVTRVPSAAAYSMRFDLRSSSRLPHAHREHVLVRPLNDPGRRETASPYLRTKLER
jgi:hypothetical protein